MRYIFSIILIFQLILLKLICEDIRVFLKIILNQLKFFPFLYETDKIIILIIWKGSPLFLYKQCSICKFFFIEVEMVHKKILFFYSFIFNIKVINMKKIFLFFFLILISKQGWNQKLKEKNLKHFVKSKMNVSRYFGIHAKIKLSKILEHSRKIDVSK